MRLQVPNSSLKLHYSRVFCIVVKLDCFYLSIKLFVCFLLLNFLSIQVLSITILFVQYWVFCIHYVHLKDRTSRVRLSTNDLHLLLVVLQLCYHVVQHLFKAIEVATHRELFLRSVPADNSMSRAQKISHCVVVIIKYTFIDARDKLREVWINMHISFDRSKYLVCFWSDWHVCWTVFEESWGNSMMILNTEVLSWSNLVSRSLV